MDSGSLGNDRNSESSDEDNQPPKKVPKDSNDSTRRKSKEYIPARRSGAYGLMMALLKHSGTEGHLKKKELQELAQPYADVSFAQTDVLNAQYYNAWSSMTTLVNKGLVEKQGNPARYQLTESGRSLAKRLDQAESELHSSSISMPVESNISLRPPLSINPTVTNRPTKAPAKRVAKIAAVRSELPDLLPTTSRTPTKLQTPTKFTELSQPAEIISIDDDEFDLYPQKPLSLGSTERNVPVKPTQAVMPKVVIPDEVIPEIDERIVVDEQETYIHVRDKVTLKAGEYEIVLCVDCAEVSG